MSAFGREECPKAPLAVAPARGSGVRAGRRRRGPGFGYAAGRKISIAVPWVWRTLS
jgi:hypothetical protein